MNDTRQDVSDFDIGSLRGECHYIPTNNLSRTECGKVPAREISCRGKRPIYRVGQEIPPFCPACGLKVCEACRISHRNKAKDF